MVNECLEDAGISTEITEDMTEDSSIGDDIEDITILCLEIESLTKEVDLLCEEFMVSASHIKVKSKISTDNLIKVWYIDYETVERTSTITSRRHAIMDNHLLERSYCENDKMLRYKILD